MLKHVATGWSHSLIASAKQLYACGSNDGQLGLGRLGLSNYFLASCTLPSDKNIIAIGAGFKVTPMSRPAPKKFLREFSL